MAIADVLAAQVAGLPCACLQVDEANIPGNPAEAPMAAAAINRVLDAFEGQRAVHLCFGNYGGQTIQKGEWRALIEFLNALHVDHLVLEMAHRPASDLEALRESTRGSGSGIGVVDVKVNHVETAEEIARRIECAEKAAGAGARRLGASRLRLLDAQAVGGGPQDRGAGEGARSVPGHAVDAAGARSGRSRTGRRSIIRHIFCRARFSRAGGRCSSRRTGRARRSCWRRRSSRASRGS